VAALLLRKRKARGAGERAAQQHTHARKRTKQTMPRGAATAAAAPPQTQHLATVQHCVFAFDCLTAHLAGAPPPAAEFDDGFWCALRYALRCVALHAAFLSSVKAMMQKHTHPIPPIESNQFKKRAVCDVEQGLVVWRRAAPARLHRHARAAAAARRFKGLRADEVSEWRRLVVAGVNGVFVVE
jgi:hypothetical protein